MHHAYDFGTVVWKPFRHLKYCEDTLIAQEAESQTHDTVRCSEVLHAARRENMTPRRTCIQPVKDAFMLGNAAVCTEVTGVGRGGAVYVEAGVSMDNTATVLHDCIVNQSINQSINQLKKAATSDITWRSC